NFRDYRNYLADVMVATAENAAHPDRRQRYRLLATLSSGYDSAACAAIAREAGCCEGLTFLQSTEGLSDDGSRIGEHIGLQMIGVRHPLFSDTDKLDTPGISEFFTTGPLGEEVTYATVSGLLHERLLVTGFCGGPMWDLSGKPLDRNGSSLGEFRLRENFIHLPLPFVGALQRAAVHTISNSPEMDPYKIGGNYDRPIPRRILEEAGVPRALFGQHKRAISTVLYGVYPKRPMPKSLHRAVKDRIRAEPLLARLRYKLGSVWYAYCYRPPGVRHLPGVLAGIYRRVWGSKMVRLVWPQPYRIFVYLDPIGIYVMSWALSVVGDRYRAVLNEDQDKARRT